MEKCCEADVSRAITKKITLKTSEGLSDEKKKQEITPLHDFALHSIEF